MTLWHGVVMKTADEQQVVVRAALLCAACDIPAARKTCGFVGHGARRSSRIGVYTCRLYQGFVGVCESFSKLWSI